MRPDTPGRPWSAGMLKVRIVHSSVGDYGRSLPTEREGVVYPQMLVAGLGAPASPSSGDSLDPACKPNPRLACRLVWARPPTGKAAALPKASFAVPIREP